MSLLHSKGTSATLQQGFKYRLWRPRQNNTIAATSRHQPASNVPLPRFGLRTLLIIVLAYCVLLTWFGARWRSLEEQKQILGIA